MKKGTKDKQLRIKNLEVKKKSIELKIDEETAEKLIRDHGNDVLEVVVDKPYVLSQYISDFESVKKIIQMNKGCKGKEDIIKDIVAAAIIYVLENVTAIEGHVFIYTDELGVRAKEIEEIVTEESIDVALKLLEFQKEIIVDRDDEGRQCVYPAILYRAEVQVANMVRDLVERNKIGYKELEKINEFIEAYKPSDISLNLGQKEAIRTALLNNISIIAGGAGSGKTTVLKAITDGFRYLRQSNIKLVSFTGKAVERLSKATDREATTMHKFLGLREDGRRKVNRIKADVIIVDEVGMLGLELFLMLIESVKQNENLKVVLVGDHNQLPSIAPGNVLKDLINSGVIPVVRLTEVVRQEKDSLIITNANKVLRGITLDGSKVGLRLKKGEFEFIEADSENIKEKVIRIIDKLLDKGESIYDIQVMSLIKGGENGVEELNREIADKVNYVQEREIYKFGVLDPVIVIRNNYKKEVFNGQRAVAVRVERTLNRTEAVTIDFGDRVVDFNNNEIDDIEIAYATTVHKMQGSESETVIIVVDKEQSRMLTRELLYVAITRGVERVIVVGNKEAFNQGIKKAGKERYSLLAERLVKVNEAVNVEPA